MKVTSTFTPTSRRGHGARITGLAGTLVLLAAAWGRGVALILSILVAGVLAAGMPAGAVAAPKEKLRPWKPFPQVVLTQRVRGEEAVQALKEKLPEVAAWYGMTHTDFARMLRQDRHAWINRDGRLLYIDDFPPPPEQADGAAEAVEAWEAAPAPLDQTFVLHSRPGAKRVIYLDFDGTVVTNSAWNNSFGISTINAQPYDLDGNPGAFSSTELERIQYIWQRVAEDYAPFDVDVTTEAPSSGAITRSGSTDLEFGTRVIITRDWTKLTSKSCSCGGIAYVGAFDDTSDHYKPAWVFFDRLGSGNERYVAEAISHEAGHNLGLSHDGNNSTSYYSGHGSGATGWAPIMGVGYYKELTQWSKGEYPNANQTQDDIQLIQTYGGPLRLDDHGDTAAQATPMEAVPNGSVTSLIEGGVIGGRNDVDVFSFSSGAGSISLNVLPGARGPNLDISAALFDSQGNLLALSNPVDALNAGITVAAAPAGTYYLLVNGTGKGDLTTGYSDYGSLGEYLVTGSVPSSSGSNAPPVAAASATPVSGSAPLAVSFSAGGSYDPEGGSITYDWDFGDGSAHSTSANPGHSYAAGNYTARLTVRDAGGNTDQAQVNVTASNNAPPVAVASATPTAGAAPLTVNFSSGGSYDPEGGSITYDWDFGDGSAHSTSANPGHSYAAGNYTARLTVRDAGNNTDQAQVNVTVQAGGAATVHVQNIAMSLTSTRAKATVTVTNGSGQPVSGATVKGSWSGVVSGNVSGRTDSTGKVTLSSRSRTTKGAYTFTVTSVSISGYTYDPGENIETSDSITR